MTVRSLRSNDRLRFSGPFEIGLKTSHPYLCVPEVPAPEVRGSPSEVPTSRALFVKVPLRI